ncbi:MAG: DUF6267 family protein [Sediminibacterium sp.]
MITFKQYLTEAVNSHMTHIEDLVFDLGVEGTCRAIFFLRDVRDMLAQSTGTAKQITTKFDGAPSLLAGINPENGKFFVAKKGLFNKNPKLYYSHADIDADTSGDLADKLKIAFTECKKLGIKSGIYQGDIMFINRDLKKEKIDGKNYITFHPNTIVYAVPEESELASKIKKANIGIVWHTSYSGDSLASLSATFGKPIVEKFNKTQTAWMEDATFKDVSGVATFTDSERKEFDSLLSEIGALFRSISAQTLNAIHKDSDLLELVHIFNNSKVRAGKQVDDVAKHVDEFYEFIDDRYTKELKNKKTAKAQDAVSARRSKILNFFLVHPKQEIVKIFELNKKIAQAKQLLINKLNKASSLGTFLKTQNGFKVTAPEGYVAISDQGAVKLVDRLEFSYANFSPEILRGWSK